MIEDEYYDKYFNGKLDLIFNDNGENTISNPFYNAPLSEVLREEENNENYSKGNEITPEEVCKLFPDIDIDAIDNRKPVGY